MAFLERHRACSKAANNTLLRQHMRWRETNRKLISRVASFYWVAALSLVSLGVPAGWAAPGFTAQLDRNVVPIGESVTLSLVFEDIKPAGAPALPPLQNLTVTGGVGQSSQMTFVNGQRTESLTLTYTLVPMAPGDVVIPSISVAANGRTFTSQPIQLKIVPANSPAANPAATLTNLAFIRLVVPRTDVYVGEPFAVEMHLYWQTAQD